MSLVCRGVRGAITVEGNTEEAIVAGTLELLCRMVAENGIRPEDVASVIFTATPDLDAGFPAEAARRLGWNDVALMCAREIPVPGAVRHCIRVLIHWNTEKSPGEIRHVYLRKAGNLRPDRVPSSVPESLVPGRRKSAEL